LSRAATPNFLYDPAVNVWKQLSERRTKTLRAAVGAPSLTLMPLRAKSIRVLVKLRLDSSLQQSIAVLEQARDDVMVVVPNSRVVDWNLSCHPVCVGCPHTLADLLSQSVSQ
jgi:hypothetical protein